MNLMLPMEETTRVWILFTDIQYQQIDKYAKQGFMNIDKSVGSPKYADVVYIYCRYLSKIRFKAIVSNIEESQDNRIRLDIVDIYRGNELSIFDFVPKTSEYNQLIDITNDNKLHQTIVAKFALDKLEQKQIQSVKSTSPSQVSKDEKMPISFYLFIIICLVVIIGIVVLIGYYFDGILFAICAFIGIGGMVCKELFR